MPARRADALYALLISVLHHLVPLVESSVVGAVVGLVVQAVFFKDAVIGLILAAGDHGSNIQVLLKPALAEYLDSIVYLSFVINSWCSRAGDVGGELEGVGFVCCGRIENA